MSDFPNGYLKPTHTGDGMTTDWRTNNAILIHGVLIGNLQLIVKEDAGGYPYIPIIELYDYEKDIPLAKVGDKVKVLIFKEE